MKQHDVGFMFAHEDTLEAQSMQTHRVLTYLVENILLLFGGPRDEDRSRKGITF